jgi:hypothetical protein
VLYVRHAYFHNLLATVLLAEAALAQDMPAEYAAVLKAFYGSDADAVVAGDVAMRAEAVTPVLKALRSNGIDVVAIHHHMTTTAPTVYFLHYWGRGPAQKLASAFRAALDQTRNTSSTKR